MHKGQQQEERSDTHAFEHSLGEMLRQPARQDSESQALERALSKASRQTAAGSLFLLFARALEAVMIGLSSGSADARNRADEPSDNNEADKHDAT